MAGSTVDARVFVQDGFAWDGQDAYLFDIDGTLLRSRDRVHYDSFFSAAEAVLGRTLSLDGVVLHGNTDPGILRDAFRIAKLDDAEWRGALDAIGSHMGATVAARRSELELWTMPGVEAMLGYLKARGARLGVATGNLKAIGWIKIEAVGLRDWFTFGGFSDGFDVRADMIRHALRIARSMAGDRASVCVVGDTPADVFAARANGLATIAVATGNYSFEQLMEAEPEACCTTLGDLLASAGAGAPVAAGTSAAGME